MGAFSFDLYQAAEGFYREFPARKADTVIADVNGTADELRARMRGIFPYADRRFPGDMAEWVLRDRSPQVKHLVSDDDGIFRDPDVEDGGQIDASIILSPARAPKDKSFRESIIRDYFLKRASLTAHYRNNNIVVPDEPGFDNDDYWLQKVFDHESAHALFAHDPGARKFGGRGPHFEESVCDAYALIRHYQRFGADTGFDRALILNRARLIPDMRTPYARSHMTVACLEAVRAMDRAELMSLSPQQSFDLAVRVARDHSLSNGLLDDFGNAASESRDLKTADLARYYAKSALPPVLVGDYIDAELTLQPNDTLDRAALEGARRSLAQTLVLS